MKLAPFTLFTVLLAAAVPPLVTLQAPAAQAAEAPVYTSTFSNLAVSGYDPVAYFTEGKPVRGSSEYEVAWEGARWRFASAAHRGLFTAEPARYAPQYGGYCAWAVSQGYTASADPLAWKIVNNRLYLNYNHDVQKTWETDVPGNVVKADQHWPTVLQK